MHKKLHEMLAKKGSKPMSENEKHAKIGVLGDLKKMAEDAMGDHMSGMKKVSVMSDSKEGLKHGLDTAKHVMSSPEMDDMVDQAESNKANPHAKSHDEFSGHMNLPSDSDGQENEDAEDAQDMEDRKSTR